MQNAKLAMALTAAVLLATGTTALAHVTVAPLESKPAATERYTVRVPTEGQVTTTSVELEIPSGMTVIEVVPGNAYTFETRRTGDRIVAITWKQEIPPKSRGEFVFVAQNPASGDLSWKAHQRFADGTTADWVGPTGDRRPAAITTLVVAPK